jgi:hypothetical protein
MITIFHIFYNQHEMLKQHFSAWTQHPKRMFRYVIIDDCSPKAISERCPVEDFSICRVDRDIPWNIMGSRNLGFSVAPSEWVLGADVDHVITPEAARKILSLDLSDPNVVYTFRRIRETDGYEGCPAIINLLMNKKRFMEVGGYDEDFAGHYGAGDTFFHRCLERHSVKIVRCDDIVLSWHPVRGGTRGLRRDKTVNRELFKAKIAALDQGTYKNGPILRFKWTHFCGL